MSPALALRIEFEHNAGEVRRETSTLDERFNIALVRMAREALEIFEEEGVRHMGRSAQNARAAIKTDEPTAAPGGLVSARAYTDDDISYWRQVGTGLFGPYAHRIVPTEKKALAFKIGGKTIVRRSVKGAKPNFWFDVATLVTEARSRPIADRHLAEALEGR